MERFVSLGAAQITICNALSLSMISSSKPGREYRLKVREISTSEAAEMVAAEKLLGSAIGHPDTAAMLSGILGLQVPVNRVSVTFTGADRFLLVAQYHGPRLPEGTTTLPEGASFRFFVVSCEFITDHAKPFMAFAPFGGEDFE